MFMRLIKFFVSLGMPRSDSTPNIVHLTKRDLKALRNADKKVPSEHVKNAFREMKQMLIGG